MNLSSCPSSQNVLNHVIGKDEDAWRYNTKQNKHYKHLHMTSLYANDYNVYFFNLNWLIRKSIAKTDSKSIGRTLMAVEFS